MTIGSPADARAHLPSGKSVSETTIDDVLTEAVKRLDALVDAPRLEAETLLAQVLGVSRSHFRARPERALAAASVNKFRALVERRRIGVPNAYLTGRREFWSIDFEVNEAVLIPRHETECLVEVVLSLLPPDVPATVADIGTGCGAVTAALATERRTCQIIATDLSRQALAVARGNLLRMELQNVALAASRWLAPFGAASFDLIASNPPYVAEGDPHLRRGDLRFEPRIALAAGADGLDAVRALADDARRCLKPGGFLVLEHGFDQGTRVRALLAGAGYGAIVTHEDYAGRDRVTRARRRQ